MITTTRELLLSDIQEAIDAAQEALHLVMQNPGDPNADTIMLLIDKDLESAADRLGVLKLAMPKDPEVTL